MAESTIKSQATVEIIGEQSRLYRIGNLRILQIQGKTIDGHYLNAEDRPSVNICGAASTNYSDGSTYTTVGKIIVNNTGLIDCLYSISYYSGSVGWGHLTSNNQIYGTVVWTV